MVLKSLLIIIAAFNEEEGIKHTLSEIAETLDNPMCLVIDGNSTDRTVQTARKMGAEIIIQDGIGKGNAISQALAHVDNNPQYVAFIDGDFTYPAGYISEMVKILDEKPKVGMVLGNRINHMLRTNAMKSPFHLGNRILALAQYIFNGVNLIDPLSGLRVVRWSIIKDWAPKAEGFDIEAEMNFHIEKKGYLIEELLIVYRKRLGPKKLGLKDGLPILRRILIDGIRSSFST